MGSTIMLDPDLVPVNSRQDMTPVYFGLTGWWFNVSWLNCNLVQLRVMN